MFFVAGKDTNLEKHVFMNWTQVVVPKEALHTICRQCFQRLRKLRNPGK